MPPPLVTVLEKARGGSACQIGTPRWAEVPFWHAPGAGLARADLGRPRKARVGKQLGIRKTFFGGWAVWHAICC